MRNVENLLEQKPEEVKAMILKEFGNTEEDTIQCIQIIKDWIKNQPHLPETPSDHQIRQFLNFNKYSIEKAKQRIDMYYTARTLIPEFFEDTHPCSSHMKEESELIYYLPLPVLAPSNRRVTVCRFNESCTVERTNIERFISHYYNMVEVLMQEDLSLGLIIVFDCTNFKAGHIPKFTIMLLRKAQFIMEKVYSNRITGIHMINAQPYIDILVNLFKTVLSPKISSRIQVHKTMETLYDFVPKDILPEDLGGEEVSLEKLNDLWQEKFAAYKSRFDKLEKLRVNENLRPEPLVNDEILGYYGNFKKLAVD